MNITLDGYLSGPHCELDWHFERWNRSMGEKLMLELSKADTVLLGRTTYLAMAQYWTGKEMDPFCPREDIAFAAMLNNYPKFVFSNTLEKAQWRNSRILKGNVKTEIRKLKKVQPGQEKGIMVYGSGLLVRELVQLGLIDEYHLWVHPVLLGNGKALFSSITNKHSLQLQEVQRFSSGVVLLQYLVLP
jgi:dihydrofolate reductase